MAHVKKDLRILIIFVAAVMMAAAVLFSGCGTKEETKTDDSEAETVDVTEKDESITTEVDKEFAVRLSGNEGTGYSWTLAKEPDSKLLTKVWEDTYVDDLKPGAENLQVFKFKALAEGSTSLEFQYTRPWETGEPPEKTRTVTVTIKKGNQEETKEYSDPSMPIDVKKGEGFIIVLEANPSTGYTWELADELDSSIVRFESNRYGTPQRTAQAGSPQSEYWLFDTVGTGATEISFKYLRTWEEGIEPEKTVVFTVNVAE